MPTPHGAPTRLQGFGDLSGDIMQTPFGEPIFARLDPSFGLRPTWGVSVLRDETTTTGTGTVTSSGGQIVVSSGSTAGSTAAIQTRERGQYIPGGAAQAGVGVQTDRALVNDEEIEVGCNDLENGFGFVIRSDGIFPFVRTGGTTRVITDTNGDILSQSLIDPQNGTVLQVDWTWYGHGAIEFKALVKRGRTKRMILLHTEVIDGLTVIDPNQPIRVKVNNGSEASDLVCRIGGRQYATTRQGGIPERPTPNALDYGTTVGGGSTFENLLTISPKATFNGRPNSVRAALAAFQIQATSDMEWRVSFAGSIDDGASPAPVAPADVDASETAIEVRRVTDGAIVMSDIGRAVYRGYVSGGTGGNPTMIQRQTDFALGTDGVVLFAVRPLSSDGTVLLETTVTERW